jgi:MFS family permease
MASPLKPMTPLRRRLEQASGGPARARVVAILALVLALDTADVAVIGAIAGKVEVGLRIGNTELGLLAALPSLMVAVGTVPVGLWTDRVRRVPLLTAGVIVWSLAEAASALPGTFIGLLLVRLVVGAATAPAGPTLSSLLGDYFPARERARIFGLILSGELVGAGFGFLLAGEIASVVSWRWSFVALALPGLWVAWLLHRHLPEPARGGASRLQVGAAEIVTPGVEGEAHRFGESSNESFEASAVQREVARAHVQPDEDLVLHEGPQRMSLWQATRYVLRIRTNLILILASALGYFYFQGVETFGTVFIQSHYGLPSGVAVLVLVGIGVAALVGVVAGGQLADSLLARGRVNVRIDFGAVGFLAAAALFLPALLVRPLLAAIPFYLLAGIAFAMRDPTLDAARLDIMHHRLWGRAEAVRSVLRRLMTASAPIAFGALAGALGRGRRLQGVHGFGAGSSGHGLWLTFLVLLAALVAGGLLTLLARRTYPRDVATAVASEQETCPPAARRTLTGGMPAAAGRGRAAGAPGPG